MKASKGERAVFKGVPHTNNVVDSSAKCGTVVGDMANLEKELIQKVKELEAAFANAEVRRTRAIEEHSQLWDALSSARLLLLHEQRARGLNPEPVKKKEVEGPISKTAAILSMLEGTGGSTSVELYEYIQATKIGMSRQHLYNMLSRLRGEGRVEKRGETYYVVNKK